MRYPAATSRRALRVLSLGTLTALGGLLGLAACSSDDGNTQQQLGSGGNGAAGGASSGGSGGAETLPGPEEWNREVTAPSTEEATTGRTSCQYKAGALPKETHGAGAPMGDDIPIDHIVVVMSENRSFDHYLQGIRSIGIDADVAPDTYTNPDEEGTQVAPARDSAYCFADTPHNWNSTHRQINGGKMDGFVTEASGSHETPMNATLEYIEGKRALTYYTEEDVPLVYWMAKNFSIGDRYFCSVPGPTWPNREYLWAATSFGQKGNDFPQEVDKTIFTYLNERQLDWKFYHQNTPSMAMLLDEYFKYQGEGRFHSMDDYYADAAAGTLPQVAIVDPGPDVRVWEGIDEHPPAQTDIGQNWMSGVVRSLVQSPNWESSALFITYDEHGGFYDHVSPPETDDDHLEEGFGQLGFRVPALVVGPWVKQGVDSSVFDNTSVLKYLCERFGVEPWTRRIAAANSLGLLLDSERMERNEPIEPPVLDAVELPDEEEVEGCQYDLRSAASGQPELEDFIGRHLPGASRLDQLSDIKRRLLDQARERGVLG